jgi:hypothetical protein
MRQRNMRIVYAGAGLIVLAVVFFLIMLSMAPQSNDPVALMQTVGQVVGVVGGISLTMIIVGLIGTKPK